MEALRIHTLERMSLAPGILPAIGEAITAAGPARSRREKKAE
jgi:hypothetical protein